MDDFLGVTKVPVAVLQRIQLPSGSFRDVQRKCWNWQSKTPRYRKDGDDYSIRRLLGELVYGPLPHSNLRWVCRGGRCVNPAHMDQSLVRISQEQGPVLLYTNPVAEYELVSFGEIVMSIRMSHTGESSPQRLWKPYFTRVSQGSSPTSGSSKPSSLTETPGTPSSSPRSQGRSHTPSGGKGSPSTGSVTQRGRSTPQGEGTRPRTTSGSGYRTLSHSTPFPETGSSRTSTTPSRSPTSGGREPTVRIHEFFVQAWDWWRGRSQGRAWMDEAACRYIGSEPFFPPAELAQDSPVRSVCRECPVRIECLGTSLGNREVCGVWGGFTASERERYAGSAIGLAGAAGRYR